MSETLQEVEQKGLDTKVKELVKLLKKWIKDGLHPIIYCRYINTAKYVGDVLQKEFGRKKSFAVLTVTSEDPDELRKEKVEALAEKENRVLVATDCMSEGINLQSLFTAVVHYDLPWNPNRLEQREGRVCLLYTSPSPRDATLSRMPSSA